MPADTHPEDMKDASEDYFERFERRMERSNHELKTRMEHQMTEILEAIQRMNRMLMWIDRLLRWTQPPATGRIRLEWIRPTKATDRYSPKLGSGRE